MSLPGPIPCIVGPTASGKSSLADLVAQRLGGPVVSVDAMQVYRSMDVGTAKTPVAERRVPLLMVDVADVGEAYSVQRFQADARKVVDDLLDKGVTPVLCGGTGLYLNAVIDDMRFPAGTVGGEARVRYEEFANEHGPEALHGLLIKRDPQSAALIHPNNVRRTVRALELLDEGVSYADNNRGLHVRAPLYDARLWGLTMSRERLYARIDERVDQMFAAGLVDEVRLLRERGLDESVTARQAIGYKEVLDALDGTIDLDLARELVKRRTRHYAKRQLSWFGHDERVRWIDLDRVSLVDAADLVTLDLGA